MAGELVELDTSINDRLAPRGVYLTKRARKEFDALEPKTAEFLVTVMKTWAWAKSAQFEPGPEKFKRLGSHKCGRNKPPLAIDICEFKRKVTRVYGHETRHAGRHAIILVQAEASDKGGQAGNTQQHSIETAAKRAGKLYD